MNKDYQADLTTLNERTTPETCHICQRATGIIWHANELYCAACSAASTPVAPPTAADIAAALARDPPLLTAHGAMEVAYRAGGKKR